LPHRPFRRLQGFSPSGRLISAESPPALFHAGSALGLHPSELSPLKQPNHLSMTRALLTLTRHRLHRRPARTPLLNIRFCRSRCNDLVTAPSNAADRSRQRLADAALPRPGFHHEPRSVASTSPPLSGAPTRHLPGTEAPFQHRAGSPRRCQHLPPPRTPRREGSAASSAFHGSTLALANPLQRPEGHHRQSAGRRLHRLPESRLLRRPLGRFTTRPEGHATPRSKLALRPVVRQDRLPLMSTSSF
jgi:hypothetical protein